MLSWDTVALNALSLRWSEKGGPAPLDEAKNQLLLSCQFWNILFSHFLMLKASGTSKVETYHISMKEDIPSECCHITMWRHHIRQAAWAQVLHCFHLGPFKMCFLLNALVPACTNEIPWLLLAAKWSGISRHAGREMCSDLPPFGIEALACRLLLYLLLNTGYYCEICNWMW